MPKPKPNEKEDAYVQRCIPVVLDEGTAKDGEQAAAICHSMWREAKKLMDPNQELLDAIRQRTETKSKFNYGITTADRYVRTLVDRLGSDLCYQMTAKGLVSFEDVMQKAAETLVYSNEEMEVYEKAVDRYGEVLPEGVELPKDTLMVFRHTLSSSRKDRDGDILRSEGMEVDPKMLLLWQHVHTMPIGKMLAVALQNSKTLDLWSAIVDINETSHDSAVMVDNGMGRFSHGFKAKEFDKVKEGTKEVGFDIKRCEVVEESLVSIPANVDAETQEVMLSLVDGGKLTSSVMKALGKDLRRRKAPVVAGISFTERRDDFERVLTCGSTDELELIVKMGIVGDQKDENETRDKGREAGTPEETKGRIGREKEKEAEGSSNEEVRAEKVDIVVCPKCGSKNIVDGVCKDCGYVIPAKEKPRKVEEGKNYQPEGKKKGRVLSGANERILRESHVYATKAYELGPPIECKACIGHASRGIKTVLDSLGTEDKEESGLEVKNIEETESVESWLSKADRIERNRMIKLLAHLNDCEDTENRTKSFRRLIG